MAKISTLLDKAKSEINDELEEQVVEAIKESLLTIEQAEKALAEAKKSHQQLLDGEVEDFEPFDW